MKFLFFLSGQLVHVLFLDLQPTSTCCCVGFKILDTFQSLEPPKERLVEGSADLPSLVSVAVASREMRGHTCSICFYINVSCPKISGDPNGSKYFYRLLASATVANSERSFSITALILFRQRRSPHLPNFSSYSCNSVSIAQLPAQVMSAMAFPLSCLLPS